MATNNLYITITESFIFNSGVAYLYKQQLLFIETQIALPDYKGCSTTGYELHYLGVNCDDEQVLIPARFSVLDHNCIDVSMVNTYNYLQDKYMDKTTDYYKMVREIYGYDMANDHMMQFDERFYTAIDLIPPGKTNDKRRGENEETISFDRD